MEPAGKKPAAVHKLRTKQEIEARFEALLDASPDGIVVTDGNGRIEVFNAAAERLFGYPEAEVLGTSIDGLIGGAPAESGYPTARALLQSLGAGSSEGTAEFSARRSDGTHIPVELSVGQTQADDQGAFIVVVRNLPRRRQVAAAMARSESNLSMSQALAHLGSFEFDFPETGHAYWSDEIFRILGRDRESGPLASSELIGLVHADDRERVRDAVIDAARQGGALRIQHGLLTAYGEHRQVETRARITAGDADGRWRIRGTLLEVSDLHRFERALRREQNRAETYLDLVGAMIIALDAAGHITLVNREGLEILGRDEADILGRNFFQLFVAEPERPAALARFHRALSRPGAEEDALGQLWLDTGSGRRLVRWRNQPLVDGDGQVTGLLCAVEDMTEQHLTENRLKHAEEELRLTFQYAPIGMATLDIDGHIASVNHALCAMLRFDETDLLGRPVADIAHPDDRPTADSLRQKLLRGEAEYLRQEKRYRRKDGTDMFGVVRYSLVRDLRGRPLMFVVQIVDRTEQMEAELEIRQHRDRIGQAARLGTMGEMAAAIAHELNQPLTAISSYVQAVQRMIEAGTMQPPEIMPVLGKVHDQARRAGRIILGLRNFVKQRGVSRQPTDMQKVLRDVLMLAELDARAHGIPLHPQIPDALPRVQADPVQLQQVLLNLIRNAVDAMSDRPGHERGIRISVMVDDAEEVSVSVADTGPGVAPENRDKLFKPFFTTKPDGMGMGLSLSRSIVEAHGGHLDFTDNPGGGSIFVMTLPTLPGTD